MRAAPHPTDVRVGERLRRQRTLLGMSQERLGSLLGVTYQQIQKYERGVNRIGSSRLHELARVLAVPVSYFFAEIPPTPTPGLAEAPAPFLLDGQPEGGEIDRRETLELVRAFNRIDDPQVRRRVLELARALAAVGYRAEAGDGRGA